MAMPTPSAKMLSAGKARLAVKEETLFWASWILNVVGSPDEFIQVMMLSLIWAVIGAPGDVQFVVKTGEVILTARTCTIRARKRITENIVKALIVVVLVVVNDARMEWRLLIDASCLKLEPSQWRN